MAFPIDPGRPPGMIQPLENLVPNQGNVDPRAMLPLAPAREQQHHDVRQHAGLGHGQHDDQEMNLEDMLPLRQAFNLDQEDAMLEDDNNQLREQIHLVMFPIDGSITNFSLNHAHGVPLGLLTVHFGKPRFDDTHSSRFLQ